MRRLGLLTFLAGSCCGPNAALSADYAIAYGIVLPDLRMKGVLNDCKYEKVCETKIEGGKAVLRVNLGRSGNGTISLDAKPRCCLFSFGSEKGTIWMQSGVQHLAVFVGRIRQQNEIVQNHKIGDVYIAISR